MKPKKRYVLGEGYPWGIGERTIDTVNQISMMENPIGINVINLKFPLELWAPNCPKYRLVLEQIEEK